MKISFKIFSVVLKTEFRLRSYLSEQPVNISGVDKGDSSSDCYNGHFFKRKRQAFFVILL